MNVVRPRLTTKVAIIGFGREGRSLLKFLRRAEEFRKAKISILDKNTRLEIPRGVKSRLGSHYLENLEGFDIIFRSPGIPYMLPALQRARRHGVKILSATRLFFEAASKKTQHIIGITGTKGKGTTSTLLSRMLKANGKNVFLAGNIGAPMLDALPRLRRNTWVILELSSFQLQDLEISPHIAVVLHVFPDHQDSHKNLREYYDAKANIARHQKPGDKIFFFANDPMSRRLAASGHGRKIPVDPKRFGLFGPKDLKIRGRHNFENAAMAATVARAIGIPSPIIRRTAKAFPGLEHRLELVRRIGHVEFYNDSASTNPDTAAAAIRAFPQQPTILIAGGQDKNLNYRPLTRALSASGGKKSQKKLVILFGQNRNKIKKQIANSGARIAFVPNLASAVKKAYLQAISYKLQAIVLFSPGATSFDMFHDYQDRGNQFKKIVRSLH